MTLEDRIAAIMYGKLSRKAEVAFDAVLIERPHLREMYAKVAPDMFKAFREHWIHGYTEALLRLSNGRENL
jgi:hypothetical protein